MHHIIAGLELHEIDGLTTAFRRFVMPHRRCTARQITFGEQGDLCRVVDETVDCAGSYAFEVGDAGLVDRTLETCQRALRAGRHGHGITGFEQSLDARRGLLLIASEFPRTGGVNLNMTLPRGIHTETRELPYIMTGEGQGGDGLFKIVEIRLIERNRRSGPMPGSRDMPACGEELVGRLHQIVGGPTQLFWIGKHDQRIIRQHSPHRFHGVDKGGQQRFHTFHHNSVGNGFEHVIGVGDGTDQRFRSLANIVGQLQLTAWRRPYRGDVIAIRTLVGCMEFTDRVDFVSEEFDAHRMRQRRREHIDDASTHREFPTVHHQLDPRVGVLNQSSGSLIERNLLTPGEDQRSDIAQSSHHRLNQGTYRHDENPDGAEHGTAVLRMLQSAKHRHAARHGIRSGGKPLMG